MGIGTITALEQVEGSEPMQLVAQSVDHLPVDRVLEARCESELGNAPVTIVADLGAGEHIHRYRRTMVPADGRPPYSVDAYEVHTAAAGTFGPGKHDGCQVRARLFAHPEHGLILTTRDMNF